MKLYIILFIAFSVAYFGWRLMAGQKAKPMVLEKIKNGALIVDVRSPGEFQSGAYPGAINIPVDQVSSRIKEFGDKNRPIVVYCAAGGRSSNAKSILESAGYTDVTNGGGLGSMPR